MSKPIIDVGLRIDAQDQLHEIEQSLNHIASKAGSNLSKAAASEIAAIKNSIAEINATINTLSSGKVTNKAFANATKLLTEQIQDLDKRTTNLEEGMSKLVNTMDKADGSSISKEWQSVKKTTDDLTGSVGNLTNALQEVQNVAKRNGGTIHLVDTSELNKLEEEKRQLKEIISIIDGELKSDVKLAPNVTEATEQLRTYIKEIKKVQSELYEIEDNPQDYEDSYVTNLRNQLAKYYNDLEEFTRQFKTIKIGEALKETINDVRSEVSENLFDMLQDVENRMEQVQRNIAGLGNKSAIKPDENKTKLTIPLDISTTPKGLVGQAERIIQATQNSLRNKPLEIEFKLISAYSSKKTNKALKEFQTQIGKIEDENARKEFEAVYDQIAKDFNKEINLKVTSDVKKEAEKVKNVIAALKKELETEIHIFPVVDIDEKEKAVLQVKLDKISDSLKLTIKNIDIDEKAGDKKGKQEDNIKNQKNNLKELSKELEQVIKKVQSSSDKALKPIIDNLNLVVKGLNVIGQKLVATEMPIDTIISSINELGNAIKVAFNIPTQIDLDNRFKSMQESISKITGDLRGGDNNKKVQELKEIIRLYQEYKKYGGQGTVEELGGAKNVQNWLQKHQNDIIPLKTKEEKEYLIDGENAGKNYAEGINKAIPDVESANINMINAGIKSAYIAQNGQYEIQGNNAVDEYLKPFKERQNEIQEATKNLIKAGINVNANKELSEKQKVEKQVNKITQAANEELVVEKQIVETTKQVDIIEENIEKKKRKKVKATNPEKTDDSILNMTDEELSKAERSLGDLFDESEKTKAILKEQLGVIEEINKSDISSSVQEAITPIDKLEEELQETGKQGEITTDRIQNELTEINETINRTSENLHYLTNDFGELLIAYRGVEGTNAGLSSYRKSGTFWTNSASLASSYGDKIESAHLIMNNPFEINVGGEWNEIQLGKWRDSIEEYRNEIDEKVQEIQVSLNSLKQTDLQLPQFDISDEGELLHFGEKVIKVISTFKEFKDLFFGIVEESSEANLLIKKLYDNFQNLSKIDFSLSKDLLKTDEVVELAKILGHDGVIFKNIRDGSAEITDVFVTINEKQIDFIKTLSTQEAAFQQALEELRREYSEDIYNFTKNMNSSELNDYATQLIENFDIGEYPTQFESIFQRYEENGDIEEAKRLILRDVNIIKDAYNELYGISNETPVSSEISDNIGKLTQQENELAESTNKANQELDKQNKRQISSLKGQITKQTNQLLSSDSITPEQLEKTDIKVNESINKLKELGIETQEIENKYSSATQSIRESLGLTLSLTEDQMSAIEKTFGDLESDTEKTARILKEEQTVINELSNNSENTNNIADESNQLEKVEKSATEAAQSKEKFAEANKEVLSSIIDSLKGLDNEGKAFENLNKLLNTIGNKNGDEKLEKTKDAIKEIYELLNKNVSKNSLVKSLESLAKQGTNLENLATVLKASRKQIEQAEETLNKSTQQTQEEPKNPEISKELLNHIRELTKARKEYIGLINKESDNSISDNEKERLRLLRAGYASVKDEVEQLTAELGKDNKAFREFNELNLKTAIDYENVLNKYDNIVGKFDKSKVTKANQRTDFLPGFKEEIEKAKQNIDSLKEELAKPFDQRNTSLVQRYKTQIEETVAGLTDLNNVAAKTGDVSKLLTKVSTDINDNTAMGPKLKSEFKDLQSRIKAIILDANGAENSITNISKVDLGKLIDEFNRLHGEMLETQQTGKSFLHKISDAAQSRTAQFLAYYFSLQDMIRYARTAFNTINELDYALVDLKKTTTMSAEELNKFYLASNNIAKQTGVTTKEIIDQAAAWSRLNKIGLLYGNI